MQKQTSAQKRHAPAGIFTYLEEQRLRVMRVPFLWQHAFDFDDNKLGRARMPVALSLSLSLTHSLTHSRTHSLSLSLSLPPSLPSSLSLSLSRARALCVGVAHVRSLRVQLLASQKDNSFYGIK